MNLVFLNIIYVFFPIGCYFLYLVYSKVTDKKEQSIFIDLALLSSFYLVFKNGNNLYITFVIFNLILLIALHEKRNILNIILSLLISVYSLNTYGINIIYMLLGYLIVILINYFTNISNVIILGIFNLIFILYIYINNIIKFNLVYLLLTWIIILILYMIIIRLYKKIKSIVNMHNEYEKILHEKVLYESLFKITHEIKNPLAVCKGYLDMFDANNIAKSNRYAGIINEEINRTLSILNDFSNVSKLKINKQPIDVDVLVEDVCDEMKFIFKNKIDFNIKLLNKEVYINADYDRLKQVLVNALKNSYESIKKNGKISIKTKVRNENYYLTITDNGCGMDKDTLKKVGEPFYTTKKKGTGLGVCLSKEIIKAHDGNMRYISKKGEGTTLKIKIPIK